MSYQATDTVPVASAVAAPVRYVEWAPVIAGAVGASAVSFVFLTFGAAVGLSMTSAWPNSGFSAAVVGIVVAIWTCLVQIAAFAGGGYLAGRMRTAWAEPDKDEGQFRDAAHGFLVWAVGVIIGAMLLAGATGAGLRAAGSIASGAASIAAGAAANPQMSSQMMPGNGSPTYQAALDVLLRPADSQAAQTPAGYQGAAILPAAGATGTGRDDGAFRSEAGRLLTSVVQRRELTTADRTYLAGQISQRYGISQAEAEKRVDTAVRSARDAEVAVRDAADKTRRGAVLAGFLVAASLLLSCAAAVAAAGLGGRDRDANTRFLFAGQRFW